MDLCPTCGHRVGADDAQCAACGVALPSTASTADLGETQDLPAADGADPTTTPTLEDLGATQELDEPQTDRRPSGGEDGALDDDSLNRLIGGELHVYRCESLLGRGGMGHVFVAVHDPLQRRCALKILSPNASRREAEYVRRFQQEGRAAASLVHPNITTIHAIGEADGLHFLEMELLAGGSLQQLVDRRGALSPARATQLIARVSRGLAAAHRREIVHRDLKPDNVLLTDDHVPKIADFGLAKRVSEAGAHTSLAGTPHFMAPELLEGAPPSLAGDVYALGATYFVLLTGHVPFPAKNLPELMERAAADPLPRLDALGIDAPLCVQQCLDQLMAKRPEERLRNGEAAADMLHHALDQLRNLSELIDIAMAPVREASCRQRGERHEVEVRLPTGRRQKVMLQLSDERHGQQHDRVRLLLIYSVCGPAQTEFYEAALRLNADLAHGGLAIREIDGQPMFCMVDTYPWATVDPAEIRLSTLEIAEHADEIERQLTGRDVQ